MSIRKLGWNDTGVDSKDIEGLELPGYTLKEESRGLGRWECQSLSLPDHLLSCCPQGRSRGGSPSIPEELLVAVFCKLRMTRGSTVFELNYLNQ